MNLCEIKPTIVYKWFMEMFVDSSDWVMVPNVYGMGLFSDGGIFATKPYICGSAYFMKMMYSKTKDLKTECLEADIIVAAVGIPELVKGDWVKKDTIVIDVGINKTDNGIVGDVDFKEVSKNAKALTPVPGGVRKGFIFN